MKYQVSPPPSGPGPAIARAATLPLAQVSIVHCIVVGAQDLPVSSEVATLVATKARLRSRMMPFTARPTAEFTASATAATPSRSNQPRTIAAPMSALFWWSPYRISTGMPGDSAMKSSDASRAATTEPGPEASANGPEPSFRMPILTVAGNLPGKTMP